MTAWTTLPRSWKLEDVQAVLNVIITAFSGITIFVFTRCYWSFWARFAAKGRAVPVSSLLSLNTPGEAADILLLLKSHVFQHWNIVAQSLVVIALSITTLLSGPIAKYSTKLTHVVVQTEVNGLLAGRTDNGIHDSQVAWNQTQTSLDRAGFPIDELLDYLPDTSDLWVYRPDEWNNSWSMTCESVESKPVSLYLTSDCDTLTGKFGGAIEGEIFPAFLRSGYGYYDSPDFYTSATLIKDLLICMYAAKYSDWDEAGGPFGIYRTDPTWIAFPDIEDVFNIPTSILGNYFTRFKQESMAKDEISVITPRDLQRFYQTSIVTKDTQLKRPVKRKMSVRVVAVQLSTGFIAVFSILAGFICLGVAAYVLLLFRHQGSMNSLPQSRLDWLLKCIISRSPKPSGTDSRGPMLSAVAEAGAGAVIPLQVTADKKRAQFEGAVYGTTWTGDVPHSPGVHALSSDFPDKLVTDSGMPEAQQNGLG
ncbi:hypothetical protein AYL99_08351 [Fonsecaea erecta]|uniref:Uncharacterized protein n=1 Tax=Fonsecaea erecta TaxID=1367422 RepID=A0A178ZEK9_9EURO|nr:hypothetical protein AYL99_08351 [Fonsecaea erecta]OAP57613.1 hypothetical protein AYL99_08351 [Fonsecaea erecta]